jgi:hypothetical protein
MAVRVRPPERTRAARVRPIEMIAQRVLGLRDRDA